MVDIPERTESHGPVFIYGVEGEQIEEENDAYNDLRYDIGEMKECVLCVLRWCRLSCIGNHFRSLYNNFSYYRASNNNQQFAWKNRLNISRDYKPCILGLHKDYEADEAEETMPSCFPLLIFDCIFMHFKKCIMPASKEEKEDEKDEYWFYWCFYPQSVSANRSL